jgi:hypothetical protein
MLSDEEAHLKVDRQPVENVQVVLRGQALVQLGRYKPSIFLENVSSPLGSKADIKPLNPMSALPSKADINWLGCNVR